MASNFVWNTTSRRYRNTKTGTWIGHKQVSEIRNDFAAEQRGWADQAARAMVRGDWTVRRWELEIRDRLKRVFLGEYMLGRGGKNAMTQADYGRVGSMLRDQYQYLRTFALEVQAGMMSQAQIVDRTQMYHESSIQAFERGKAAAYGDDLILPCYPADGHTACLTGNVVVDGEGIEQGFRRPYNGEIMRLQTASGKILTITPNHPVLTDRGWIKAGFLQQGDYVVCGKLGQSDSRRKLNPYGAPATISEICSTLEILGCGREPLSTMDFHGDGRNGYVDVVGSDSLLRHSRASSLFQPGDDLLLTDPDWSRRSFAGQSFAESLILGGCSAASFGMGAFGEIEFLLRGQGSHAQYHRFATGTRIDADFFKTTNDRMSRDATITGDLIHTNALLEEVSDQIWSQIRTSDPGLSVEGVSVFSEPVAYYDSRDTEFVAQGIDAHSGVVGLDEVVFVQVETFHGEVFNLQTLTGWYSANGIIVHNCRSRCRCRWDIRETKTAWKAYWRRNSLAESCESCANRERLYNPYVQPKATT